ncbi:MAG: ABC transporter substrate-binding protein [Faecousia sp.]
MKKILCLFLALVLLTGLLPGCSDNGSNGEYVPTGDALLMEGEEPEDLSLQDEELQSLTLTYFPDRSMNPLIGVNITNRVLFSLIYQGLFSVDRNNNPVPILCSYYQATADNRNYTVYIEEGAQFSDGTSLTAADVLATYEAAKNSDYYGGRFTYIDSVVQGENNSVVFHLTTAYENLPLLLDIPIVKAGHADDEFPLGSGPYCFQKTNSGAQLNKVQNWWCKSKTKLPTNAEVIALSEATSQAQVRDEFEFGDLDLAISNPMSDSYAEYRCDYELWEVENGIFLYIGCNALWSEFFKDGRNTELRQALTYAIDRETIISSYYRGRAHASTLPTSPGSPYYSESLAARYEYDPLRFVSAIQNMYVPKDDKGQPKKLLILVNCDDSARLRTARFIAKQLTELGLETGTLEYGGSTNTTYQQVLQAGSFDLYLGQTKLSANYDLSQFYKGWGNLGWGGIADNTLLNMCKEALANSGNYYNLNKMVADDGKIVPVLFGYYEIYAERGQLLDLAPSRDNIFFYSLGKTMESSRLATEYG